MVDEVHEYEPASKRLFDKHLKYSCGEADVPGALLFRLTREPTVGLIEIWHLPT